MLFKIGVEFDGKKSTVTKKSRKVFFGLIPIPEKTYCASAQNVHLFDDYYFYFTQKLREVESKTEIKDFETQEQCEKYMEEFVREYMLKMKEKLGKEYKINLDYSIYSIKVRDLPISKVMKLITIEEFQKEFGNLDINFLSKQCKGE